ncbi:unnamed protein product [Gongylonema pulchrum]|uniref:Zinc finger protein n=1 Tax=Gongylonema pulchrum TaxID=637853 RepID=A0A183E0B7_9BILA|nr:unnamed protein product [Gongylonema pulchrum]
MKIAMKHLRLYRAQSDYLQTSTGGAFYSSATPHRLISLIYSGTYVLEHPIDLSLPKNTLAPLEKQQYNIGNTKQSQQHPETSHCLAITQPVQPPISKANANASLVSRQVRKLKLYQCPECGKQLGSTSSLYSHHLRYHSVETLHVCCVCSKKCIANNELITHMRVHSGERPFKCSVCSQAFSQNGACERHMRKHTGKKPYACEFCNKTFSRLDNLKTHSETHNR